MNRTLINSVLHGIELTSLDLLILDCYSSHRGVFAEKVDINGREGVSFDSEVVVGYYPILKAHKQSITARLKKLVSKNIFWESNGVYGYDLKARDIHGALEHMEKESNLEDVEEVVKRKKKEFQDKLKRTLIEKREDLLRASWDIESKSGRAQLNVFYQYWTEPLTDHPDKLLWESKTAFDMFRRLLTFKQRNSEFGKESGGYSAGVRSNG